MRRSVVVWFAAAFAAAVWPATPEVRGDESAFDAIAAPDLDPRAAAELVQSLATTQSTGETALQDGPLTVVMPGTDAERKACVARYGALLSKSVDALRALGFDAPPDVRPLTIVRVRTKDNRPFAVWAAAGGAALAVREPDSFAAAVAPGTPARADGAPLLRDAVDATRRARLYAADACVTAGTRLGGPGGAAFELTRHAVLGAAPGGVEPRWFADGLAAWLEQQIAKPQGAHVCRPYAAAKPEALAKLFDDASPRAPSATRFLGRLVGVLVAGRSDVPKRLEALAAAGGAPDKAIEAAFGVPFADAVAKACEGLKASECACDDALTVACPVCNGAGRIQLDCPDCEGSGSNVCPTCRGSEYCPTPCIAGTFFIGYEQVKCKVCNKGKVRCAACSGTLRATCKACAGRKTTTYPCLACRDGRVPCPDSGVDAPDIAPDTKCPWCRDATRKRCCCACGGAGYGGCDACRGTLKVPCPKCEGAGQTRYIVQSATIGAFAAAEPCSRCNGKGFSKCTSCTNGKLKCGTCSGKGIDPRLPDDCPACLRGVLPTRSELPRGRVHLTPPLNAEESAATQAMVTKAVDFLLTCRRSAPFALRECRPPGASEVGELDEPSPFSNALTLWALALAGVDPKDQRVAGAWSYLETQARKVLEAEGYYARTQATALVLRALVLGGEDVKGGLVPDLVDKLVKGQHSNGWWGPWLDAKSYDDELDSLFVVESLRMARLKGAKVPRGVWDKALRAANSAFDGKSPRSIRSETLYGTGMLSNMALVIMAKEGTLGAKATTFDYASLPAIKKGLAWLDRNFDIRHEPQFVRGMRVRTDSDSGHAAYVFAAQRLAVLLNMDVLADENWHAAGARHLLSLQYGDGSFEERAAGHTNGPVRTTVCYLLFLLRATAPITNVDDG
jgi:hypothetical protein